MTTNEIIQTILSREDLSASSFAKAIGITPTQIYDLQSGKIKKISAGIGNKVIAKYPRYNLAWLLTGEGEMLNESTAMAKSKPAKPFKTHFKEESVRLVPLYNVDSVGGMHSQNEVSTPDEQHIEGMIPFQNARPDDIAIKETGDSMSPKIPSGAIMLLRKVEDWREYFGYGHVYVLVLRDGRRITKRVTKSEENHKEYILCESINPDYPSEELPKRMVAHVWKVIGVIVNEGY